MQSHKAFPEDGLYMAGWCILALAAFLILIKNIFFPGFLVLEHMRPCLLYSLTGFFCPGCGGNPLCSCPCARTFSRVRRGLSADGVLRSHVSVVHGQPDGGTDQQRKNFHWYEMA